jgi:hypothetical protein
MNKKIKIVSIVIGAILLIMTPIVMATWGTTHNSGSEPFKTTSVADGTGTKVVGTSSTTPIIITNNGTTDINCNLTILAPLEGDSAILMKVYNLTELGAAYAPGVMQANVTYVWLNFPDDDIASNRGWLNFSLNTWLLNYSSVIASNSNLVAFAKWVSTENGHTADDAPPGTFSLDSTDELWVRVWYTIDTNWCDENDYFAPSGHSIEYCLTYYE